MTHGALADSGAHMPPQLNAPRSLCNKPEGFPGQWMCLLSGYAMKGTRERSKAGAKVYFLNARRECSYRTGCGAAAPAS